MAVAASPETLPGDVLRWVRGTEEGGEDVAEGFPVEHWHLLMQEGIGWQQHGLSGAEQPLLWPLPLQQHLYGGGDLLLVQGQSQARMKSNQNKQEQRVQARPRALQSICLPVVW